MVFSEKCVRLRKSIINIWYMHILMCINISWSRQLTNCRNIVCLIKCCWLFLPYGNMAYKRNSIYMYYICSQGCQGAGVPIYIYMYSYFYTEPWKLHHSDWYLYNPENLAQRITTFLAFLSWFAQSKPGFSTRDKTCSWQHGDNIFSQI